MSDSVFHRLLMVVERHWLILILSITGLRLAFVMSSDLDLIGDESYYWDWSRQPDWCYFSKPPMVAWLIHVATLLFGHITWVVRLPAVLLGVLALWFFHATARAMYGVTGAALALLLLLATPVNVLANFLMTIDPPLYCFWIMSLYFLQRALFQAGQADWLWAGCAGALALLSKQAAMVLPLTLLIFLALDPERRVYLKKQFFWYLLPLLLAAWPMVYWNQQHDWVMLGHSQSHFGNSQSKTLIDHLQQSAEFMAYQALLMSPLIFALVVVESVRGLLGFKALEASQRFLWLMGPVAVLLTLLLSLLQKAQGNWSMPFYFAALLFLVGQWRLGRWHKALRYALTIGYLMVGLTYVLPMLMQALHWQQSALDPTKRFKHWHSLVADVQQLRTQAIPNVSGSFVVALGHRYLASQLAFYLPDHPQVFRFETSGQVISQYEVWPGPVAFIGRDALIVASDGEKSVPVALRQAFEHFQAIATVPNPDKPQSRYHLFLGHNLMYWPDPLHKMSSESFHVSPQN